MSAKLRPSPVATTFKMKKDNREKVRAKLQHGNVNGGNGTVPTADVADAAQVNGYANSANAFVTILQELLRNMLPKFDPVAMMEFRAVLEREVVCALEAKGVCECNPDIAAALKKRQARLGVLKESLNDITQVSELNDIKRVASSRIRLLTKGKTYTRKMIKGNEYLYEVYWEPNEKKKKYKYIGPANPVTAQSSKNGSGERG